MSKKKQKLELTWIGKEKRPRLEPRILVEDKSLSYSAEPSKTEITQELFEDQGSEQPKPLNDNILIHGDNLLALKALEHKYAGKVKCIYIDPPFNTGGAFQHYDDGLEHSIWLSLMSQRLEAIKVLLSNDGAIVVNLDDSEMAYCKIIMDEVFGRQNYVTTIVVQAATGSSFKTVNTGPVDVTQYLLFYAKEKKLFNYKQQYTLKNKVDLQHFSRFITNPEDSCKEWLFRSINDYILETLGYKEGSIQAKWIKIKKDFGDFAPLLVEQRANEFAIDNAHLVFETKTLQKPSPYLNKLILKSKTLDYPIHVPRDNHEDLYLLKGRQIYFLSKSVGEIDGSKGAILPITTIWNDIPTNNLPKEGGVSFPSGKKPEALLRRLIDMTSDEGDIILDSFGGSGTTAAVAHKMKRRWITVELGDQCETHILPRLKRVIDGTDQDGISKVVDWQGGGGLHYYRMADSLLKKDAWNNWVINPEYNAEMLSEAMCKHMGYIYEPSQDIFWQHGHSTENNYIYITTGTLSNEQLKLISSEVGSEGSLLICCKGFIAKTNEFDNLSLKKIPQAILHKCEWDHDDYSFHINVLPDDEEEESKVEIDVD
ncbi:site-specific DNA-methyltransferase [uncultured Cocleimonas sp.]|uniref:site-specific DNA-methyltransferase n=1 Tax=uncultured Cocleimonas sp. TaxID=1051587 RepID=UPI002601DCBB|nr:site-specific DNA-methyltransferase [uncultured Cocleimonas sp.]